MDLWVAILLAEEVALGVMLVLSACALHSACAVDVAGIIGRRSRRCVVPTERQR